MTDTAANVVNYPTPFVPLGELKSIAEYLRRVRGHMTSMRKARVEEKVGKYRTVHASITFVTEGELAGTVVVEPTGQYEPSDGERASIREDLRGWRGPAYQPRLCTAKDWTYSLRGTSLERASEDSLFAFWDLKRETLLAVQERRDVVADGVAVDKEYRVWTPWSDGRWHLAEPDGLLPLWGLEGLTDHSTVVVHEGAKAARFVRELIAKEQWAKCPWARDLRYAAHVGWIGGALRPLATDWSPLTAKGVERVILIADNDAPGERAVSKISRAIGKPLSVVMFDKQFPSGFDLGDSFPANLFCDGVYSGPSLHDCSRPATWATAELERQPGERGPPRYYLRTEFVENQWYCTVTPKFVVHADRPNHLFSDDEFNAFYQPFSDVKDTATKLRDRPEAQLLGVDYHPGLSPGPMVADGKRLWNAYQPPTVRPVTGDARPWLEFLEHLFPVPEDRRQAARWLATLIARPATRMEYAMLLISETQGVGKSTLGVILKPLIGASNVSVTSAQTIVESQFTGWLARKRLVIVNEIYEGHNSRAYDKLKTYVTDTEVECNEKHIRPYPVRNWVTFLACSNSTQALHLDDEDRRWFVPSVTNALKPRVWWEGFHRWLAGDGLGIIRAWAEREAQADPVLAGERAPESTAKSAIIEDSRSEGNQLAREIAAAMMARPERTIVTVRDVRGWIARRRGIVRAGGEPDWSSRNLDSARKLIGAMKALGVTVWGAGTVDRRPVIDGLKETLVFNFKPDDAETWSVLREHLTTVAALGFTAPEQRMGA